MSEAKFTKGEWVVKGSSMSMGANYRGSFSIESNDFSGNISTANEANKSLIEAAPKMYEALQRTNEELAFVIDRYNKRVKDPANFIDAQTCHENQMLLAKARGK